MSRVAFGKDGKSHYADDSCDSYDGPYFCPNPECGVEMRRKNLGTETKKYNDIKPYFSATKNHPHIDGCEYKKTCLSYADLDTTGFRTDTFFKGLLSGGSSGKRKPGDTPHIKDSAHKENKLTTLNQLYLYCLQHDDEDTLPDHIKIYQIFQDERNWNKNKPRNPFRMIRLEFDNAGKKYSDKYKCYTLWCFFPPDDSHDKRDKYRLIFRKDQKALFETLARQLEAEKAKQGKLIILAGGEWQRKSCEITSKRQIFILNRRRSQK